jgi:hypothetical protein
LYVLTFTPGFLTVEECRCVSWFYNYCAELREGVETIEISESNQPDIIQEWFDQWCGEASVEHNLHPDDDRQELWQKFCQEVGV